ncbi:acyl-homoserine-lactone synthase [Devosia sp. CAU 1758]
MRFQIITQANEHLFQLELQAFFRARHIVYAEELQWVPRALDGLEYDEFDTGAADYLVVMEGEECVAGSRLIPTHLPHLLSQVFPDSCDISAMPRDPQVAEWTRGFVVPHRREKGRPVLLAQCCAAVMEYCLIKGYRQVGGIQDTKWLPMWQLMGWKVSVHGQPIEIDGRPWIPAYFEVTDAALAGARKLGRLTAPVLSDTKARKAA